MHGTKVPLYRIASVVGVASLLGLAACGGGGSNSSTSSTGTKSSPPATTPSTAKTKTSAPKTSAPATADKGHQLYASLGCSNCHTVDGSKSIGPTFKGLAGSKVKLKDGSTVTANSGYLLQSIVAPTADVVKGFPNVMVSGVGPTSGIPPGSVSAEDAQALVAYIKSLK